MYMYVVIMYMYIYMYTCVLSIHACLSIGLSDIIMVIIHTETIVDYTIYSTCIVMCIVFICRYIIHVLYMYIYVRTCTCTCMSCSYSTCVCVCRQCTSTHNDSMYSMYIHVYMSCESPFLTDSFFVHIIYFIIVTYMYMYMYIHMYMYMYILM